MLQYPPNLSYNSFAIFSEYVCTDKFLSSVIDMHFSTSSSLKLNITRISLKHDLGELHSMPSAFCK